MRVMDAADDLTTSLRLNYLGATIEAKAPMHSSSAGIAVSTNAAPASRRYSSLRWGEVIGLPVAALKCDQVGNQRIEHQTHPHVKYPG